MREGDRATTPSGSMFVHLHRPVADRKRAASESHIVLYSVVGHSLHPVDAAQLEQVSHFPYVITDVGQSPHLYSAGVQEGLVVVLQSLFCIGRGREANERELPRLSVFGANNFGIRNLRMHTHGESRKGQRRNVSVQSARLRVVNGKAERAHLKDLTIQ